MSEVEIEATPDGFFRTRLRYGKGLRGRFAIKLRDPEAAEKRATKMKELASMLARAGHSARAPIILQEAGAAPTAGDFDDAVRIAEALCAGKGKAPKAKPSATFQALGEEWASGKLRAKWPDHVKAKKSAALDEGRLELLYKSIGPVPLSAFTLEDAERAMAALPEELSSATRRQYAQLISKVLRLAVYPCKLIERSPLPLGFLPAVHGARVTAYLYPDEDGALLACQKVPLTHRMLYGFLAREGLRLSEALGLRWKDLDLKRGVLTLDENKTSDPRAWALSPGVAPALKAFRPDAAKDDWLIFGGIAENRAAEIFREHLGAAEITRAELFADTTARRPVRVHDLRAGFVTISLANGKSEAWVADRTGHKSSVMINRYRRQARQAAELGLGELTELVSAIPELRTRAAAQAEAGMVGQKVGHGALEETAADQKSSRFDAVPRAGIEPATRGFSILCSTN